MPAFGKVRHPKANDKILRNYLVVHGQARRVLRLQATLIDRTSSAKIVSPRVIPSGGVWCAVFSKKELKAGEYNLEIADYYRSSVILSKVEKITIDPRAVIIKGVEITFPQNMQTICPNFICYGLSEPTDYICGTMQIGEGEIVYGTTVQMPDANGLWIIRFDDVPEGEGYRLAVFNGNNNGDDVEDLLVSSEGC